MKEKSEVHHQNKPKHNQHWWGKKKKGKNPPRDLFSDSPEEYFLDRETLRYVGRKGGALSCGSFGHRRYGLTDCSERIEQGLWCRGLKTGEISILHSKVSERYSNGWTNHPAVATSKIYLKAEFVPIKQHCGVQWHYSQTKSVIF